MNIQDLFKSIGDGGCLYLCYYYCACGFDFSYDKIIGAYEALIDYGNIKPNGYVLNGEAVIKQLGSNKKIIKGVPKEGEYIACYVYKDYTHFVVKNVTTDKIIFNSMANSVCVTKGTEDKTRARYLE